MTPGTVATRSNVGANVTITARVMPSCVCGRPVTDHGCADTECSMYYPVRPVEEKGVRAYRHRDWLCRLLWAAERRLQGWREHREYHAEQERLDG